MTIGPHALLLEDDKRLHLQHGPIDLIIEAFGPDQQIKNAYDLAITRFQTILDELVEELPLLRKPVSQSSTKPTGIVAQRMHQAVLPFAPKFITPMAAVAGSVADEILAAMISGVGQQMTGLHKIYVNNGGDIAIHTQPDSTHNFSIGVVGDPRSGRFVTKANIEAGSNIGGIATSGWRGRSHSLGIADAVTVLAATAAKADVAATLLANAVNVDDDRIIRRPARLLDPDSDLGELLVVVDVGRLSDQQVDHALQPATVAAKSMLVSGLIEGALIQLQDQHAALGHFGRHLAAA
jgi:ApbE superfamily uncharacterized protein (UPF0280 family)